MVERLSPAQRFSPEYYATRRYVLDPVTGRIVEEGTESPPGGGGPISLPRYGGSNGGGVEAPAGGAPAPSPGPTGGGGGFGMGGGGMAEGNLGTESPPTASGNIDDIGGFSTIGTGLGMVTGIPGLGAVGSAIDTVRDKVKAEEFDPEYEGNLGNWGSAFINDLTGGLLGRSHHGRAIDNYQDRTGTGLNDAALAAATNPTGGGYSGPKGVNARKEARDDVGKSAKDTRSKEGKSSADRHKERNSGQDHGNDRGGSGGGSDQGGSKNDRDNAPDGRY